MPTTEYVSADELKATLSLSGTTYADDDLERVAGAASRAVDSLCGRRFYLDDNATQVRRYSPTSSCELEIHDLAVLTTLKTDPGGDGTFEETWMVNADFVLAPLDAQADAALMRPYTHISRHPNGSYVFPTSYPRTVEVTGKFGWPSVPDEVVQATTLLANRLLTQARSAPLGIVPFEGGAIRIARRDPQVMLLLGPLRRHAIGAA